MVRVSQRPDTEVGGWSGSQAGDAGPGAASRLWTVRMGHPTESRGSGDCEAPAEGLCIRPYALAHPALKSLQHPSLPPGPSKASEPWVSSGGARGLGWAMK